MFHVERNAPRSPSSSFLGGEEETIGASGLFPAVSRGTSLSGGNGNYCGECPVQEMAETLGSPYVSGRCADSPALPSADKQISAQRVGDGDWFAPLPVHAAARCVQVAAANPEDNLFRCNTFRGGPSQKRLKLTQSTRTDEVERCDFLAEFLVAADEHTRVRKFHISKDFRQESGFLHIRLDQQRQEVGTHYFEGNSGKSRTGAYVGEPTVFHRHCNDGKHTLTEVTI